MNKGRILAIDYGERRVGLAMSDPDRIIASGFKTLRVDNDQQALEELIKIIHDYDVRLIVVGLPYKSDGSLSAKGYKIKSFCETLQSKTGIPVTDWDESFSSLSAKDMLIQTETKKKRRNKEKIDELAAVVILRDYMDQNDYSAGSGR